jgi:hypothetical protein
MICRVWRGWTSAENADKYDDYLQNELFPRLAADLSSYGYRGYQLFRLARGNEFEFMTMLFFDSIDNVRSFAGENYEIPVIAPKAHALLTRAADRADHYQLRGSNIFDHSNVK